MTPSSIEQETHVFTDKVFQAVLGAQVCQTAYLGHKLGWYTALDKAGRTGLTPPELADRTSTSARYAQEWLEQQTMAGWICCDIAGAVDAKGRRYWLPPAHAAVLADTDSLSYCMPLMVLHGGAGKMVDALVEAYRKDTGVSWEGMGADAREGQAAMNRPFFLKAFPQLLDEILDPATLVKLRGSRGRVADIGAGYAYSSIGVAKHFRKCQVDAYDLDAASIQKAQAMIVEEGLQGRVTAHCVDAATVLTINPENFTPYDLVLALECIHDLADPISVLRTMRNLAGNGLGSVIVMDERVADDFASGLASPMDQLCYGFSCVCCLPDSKSHANSMATGTVMRPSVLMAFAQQAGFRDMQILPMEHDFFRFYKLIG